MNRTVRQLVQALQSIEDQDQPVIDMIIIAQDIIVYNPQNDGDRELTPEEFKQRFDENYKLIERAVDDARDTVYDVLT